MDLGGWLLSLGLEQYEAAFRDNSIDEALLPTLTAEDLKDLGIVIVGHRRKLLNAIAALPANSLASPLEVHSLIDAPLQEAAERRQVTVMFVDLVGLTALSAGIDPEDLREVVAPYRQCTTEIVRHLGGYVSQYLDHGILVFFGYPQAHEDDAERAVRAGLQLVAAIAALRTRASLRARVGIATGLVVAGKMANEAGPQERGVIGETPNLAARLQNSAASNQVIIAESTRRLIGDVFVLEKLELQNLKGFKGGMTAWLALGQKGNTSRFAAHVGTLTNFVGRDQEVALLMDRWGQANQNEGQVVLLEGEAGIGKSRIVEMFRQQISNELQITLCYQCSAYHIDSALYPIITELERATKLSANDSTYVRLEKLEVLLEQQGAKLEEAVPLIAPLLSIPSSDRYPSPDVDPQRRKERTLSVLADRLAALATKLPLLMIVEDLHWADPTTLEFFSRTILRLPEMRILLVMTYRPEFRVPWTGHAQVTALHLNRLGRRHCSAIIESVANCKALPPTVMEQIIAKTDGVPLFVEELTKTVLESGLLEEKNHAWELTRPLQEFAIPATLLDSLVARLDRLSSVKEVAQVGAAIGREFSYNLVKKVSRTSESELQNALGKLVGAQLVFARGEPPSASYVFKHALVQEAAYETLLKSNRQQLHGRIAKALEDCFPEVTDTQPEILAHHYTEAGLTEVAIKWWDKAGDLAIRRSANIEAVRHFSRAIELLQLSSELRGRDSSELVIRIKMSGPLIATRGYVTQALADNYERAGELCNKLKEEKSAFPVMYGQWVIPYVRGDMRTALANSERFLRQAEQQKDAGLLMMGHRVYGSSLVWSGDTRRGSEHLRRALSLYRATDHDPLAYSFSQHPRTAALAHLCLALQHLGFLDQAMNAGWEAISEAKRIGHFNSIAYSLCFVSLLIMLRRDTATLKVTARELLQLAERYNASYWALWAKPMLGWLAAQEGDIEAGIRQMHESTEELQKQNANLWVPQTLLLEAEILGKEAQYQRAYRLLDKAQALIEPLDQRFYEAELHRVRGTLILSESPDSSTGMTSLDRAIDVARRQSSQFLELRASVSKARLLRDRGLRKEARDSVAPVYRLFLEGLDTVDLVEAGALLEELAS
jgi:class 3 adenylate cyclase/tetratricopeptide (TPR) repeat protein